MQRTWNLQFCTPRSWIEEELKAQMVARPRALMWVKGHNGVEGNEQTDAKAREGRYWGGGWGARTSQRRWGLDKLIRFAPNFKAPLHMRWPSRAVKGLVYMVTGKGTQRQWLMEIGKTDEPWCICDGWTPQNAAHLQRRPWVGDWKGRSAEKMWRDEKWCEQAMEFIM